MVHKSNQNFVNTTHDFQLEKISGYVIEAARKTAAAKALGTEDYTLPLDMLGLRSSEPPSACLHCGKEYARTGTGRASCFCTKTCYLTTLRVERTTHNHAPADQESAGSPYPVKDRPWRPPRIPDSHGQPSVLQDRE